MASIRDISLVVDAPKQGISSSPHLGFGNLVNMDITTVPGIVQLNNVLTKKSGTTVTAQINWFVRDPVTIANMYAVDSNGVVYQSTDSGATWAVLAGNTAGGVGQGLAIWKNYLFVPRATAMDLYGPLSSSPAWRNSWAGLTMDTDSLWHPMLVSKNDGKLYGGAGRYVFSLDEVSGQTFLWSNVATYTSTAQALDLPSSYRIKCLSELGNNLMIGTWQGTNIYDIRVADIFPWDCSSVSFGQPIVMADYGVHAMLNINNALIILAGINGTVFKSDGVSAIAIGQLPTDLSGGKYLEFYPGSIISYKNKVFFGVGQGGTTAIPNMGVYSLWQTGRGNILNLEHLVSTGNDGTTNPLKPSALLPVSRDTLLVGWRDNATYGIDLTTNTSYVTSYGGYFESPLFVVGELDFLQSYLKLQFRFAKKLATGEGIQIYYRLNESDAYTSLGTWTFTTIGAVISFQTTCNIPACEMLQLKVALVGAGTTPQFKSLRLENYFERGSQAINQK